MIYKGVCQKVNVGCGHTPLKVDTKHFRFQKEAMNISAVSNCSYSSLDARRNLQEYYVYAFSNDP